MPTAGATTMRMRKKKQSQRPYPEGQRKRSRQSGSSRERRKRRRKNPFARQRSGESRKLRNVWLQRFGNPRRRGARKRPRRKRDSGCRPTLPVFLLSHSPLAHESSRGFHYRRERLHGKTLDS